MHLRILCDKHCQSNALKSKTIPRTPPRGGENPALCKPRARCPHSLSVGSVSARSSTVCGTSLAAARRGPGTALPARDTPAAQPPPCTPLSTVLVRTHPPHTLNRTALAAPCNPRASGMQETLFLQDLASVQIGPKPAWQKSQQPFVFQTEHRAS